MEWYFIVAIIIGAFILNDIYNWNRFIRKNKKIDKTKLKRGDILFSHCTFWGYRHVFNWHLPGYWTHPGIFCGFDKNGVGWVIEATLYGVKKHTLDCFLKRGPIGIGRLKRANPKIIDGAISWGESKLGAKFNWWWLTVSPEGNYFYCSEYVWSAYKMQGIDLSINPEFRYKFVWAVVLKKLLTLVGKIFRFKVTWAVTPQELYDSPEVEILGIVKK